MGLLQRLPAREILFVVALVCAAILVGWAAGRTAILTEILRPGLALTQNVVGGVKGGANYVQDLDKLRRENAQLAATINQVQTELTRRLEVDAENQRLSQLLNLAQTTSPKGVAAHVIGRAPNNWQKSCIIDRGSSAGVGVDSIVMTPSGVVGRVLKVSPNAAVVSLMTDPGQKVSVLDQRSRSPAIALGEGTTSLELMYMPQQVDFRIGDTVVTTGFGGVFPKGLPVGKVVRVEQQPNGITPRVTIMLSADLDRLEELLVLPPLASIPRL